MKVRDICTREAKACRPDTNLAAVGALMWDANCGVIPVTDDEERVLGVITDRDAYIALATRHSLAADLRAMEVMQAPVSACTLNDDLRAALAAMRTRRVRRLPVIDAGGRLQGILSLDDVALAAKPENAAKPGDVTYEDVALTLKTICQHEARTAAQEKTPAIAPAR